jgi:hypothetical protein
MNRIAVAITCGIAVSPAAGGDRGGEPPLRVFVTTARTRITDESAEALKARKDRAHEARRELERQSRDRYGKRRDDWPMEARNAMAVAEDAEALADSAYEYRKGDPRAVTDSARDIAASFEGRAGGRERVEVASSATEADLVVEVAAQRSSKSRPTQVKPDRCYVLFTVAPGARMDPDRFRKVPADYRIRKLGVNAAKIAGPQEGRPVFYFESYNGGGKEFGCQGAAASAASAAVDRFIQDNYRILAR